MPDRGPRWPQACLLRAREANEGVGRRLGRLLLPGDKPAACDLAEGPKQRQEVGLGESRAEAAAI